MNVDHFFDLYVSKDRLSATISLKNEIELDGEVLTPKELNEWLITKRISFGVNHQDVQTICNGPTDVTYPIEIAKGTKPVNGKDAYLINEIGETEKHVSTEEKNFNFRNIRTIPSVKRGQLLATIVPPTSGISGKDIYGNVLLAKPGKKLRLKAGKNTIFQNDKIWSTADGQISISPNSVNVYPVFEVKGDLDLNTGNINFIGNVIVNGDVPSGYEIKAGGDIKIIGLVEGSIIEAQGSVHISGGIAGQKKAIVKAGVDIHTQYVNQATIVAGNDIEINNFIMHSEVSAGNRILCKKAHIIGGKISAGKSIEAGEIGNQHFTRTEIFIGTQSDLIEQERSTLNEIKNMNDSLTKLAMLKKRLEEKKRVEGKLTTAEEQMMSKQHQTAIVLIQRLNDLETELESLSQQMHQIDTGFLVVYDKLYTNNIVTFSKYSKVIQQPLTYMKIYLDQGEIVSTPL